VVYEPDMKALHFGGELGYTVQENFSLLAGIIFNQYTDLTTYSKAFGLIPFELKAAMRLQVMKDLWIKSDLFAWRGAQYLTPSGGSARLDGATDLNAGVEFRITKNLNLWAQFNNLFNKEYQRWNQYHSYGFNFLAGIIFAFDQKTKKS
jgi:outer membrane receptor protein involved in Fe transport